MMSRATLLVAACALMACSDSDGQLPFGSNPGTNPFGKDLPASTGNAATDRVIKAAQACGYQSPNTVPAGWKMVLVGEQGCAISTPAGFSAVGAGTAVTSVEGNPAGTVGAICMAGTPTGASIQCTPKGASQYVLAGVEADGCSPVKQLYFKEGTEVVAGISIPKADVLISCADGGASVVGYLWVTIQGTSPLCSMLVLGFWMPEAEIETHTCTLTQILQSIRCPQPGGGFCVPADCNSDCVQLGRSGGQCHSDDACVCS